jgi:hypothetical protein
MKLAHQLGKVLEDELGKDLAQEIEQDNYLPDEAFKTARQRAIALLQSANDRVVNILTRAIIEHRENDHEENREDEKFIVETQMSAEDIEVGVRSWWHN